MFSQRVGYTSVRAANSFAKNATFSGGGEWWSTDPGAASNNPDCTGAGSVAWRGVNSSSRNNRLFSARSCASCVRNPASSPPKLS